MPTSRIIGTGAALPQQIVSNADLSKQIGLREESIEKKTGILTRHWVHRGETTATLATDAAKNALKAAAVSPDAIDLMIVSTSSPDMFFPSTACLIQKALSDRSIPVFDINASCSGFLYGLSIGDQVLKNKTAKNILVVSSEVKSVYLNKNDPQTASLFGDGAGAVVLSRPDRHRGIRWLKVYAGGPSEQLVYLLEGGSRLPLTADSPEHHLHGMQMKGTRLFRLAVQKMDEALSCLLKENATSVEKIDLFIFHQANLRILEAVLKKHRIPAEKHHTTIRKFGNSSSSSLPIALDDAVRSGRLKSGARVALCAFGGGFTWGAALIDW